MLQCNITVLWDLHWVSSPEDSPNCITAVNSQVGEYFEQHGIRISMLSRPFGRQCAAEPARQIGRLWCDDVSQIMITPIGKAMVFLAAVQTSLHGAVTVAAQLRLEQFGFVAFHSMQACGKLSQVVLLHATHTGAGQHAAAQQPQCRVAL